MKKIIILFTLVLVISCSEKQPIYQNEILWDSWGIPHIYSSSDTSLYKMMGWAQMRNHGNLILKLYGEARARSSEYWGADPKRDIILHKSGILDAAEKTYANMSSEEKAIIESFAEGCNSYYQKFPDQFDEKYKDVLPLKALDVVYHANRVMYLEFLINGNLWQVSRWKPGSNAWAINGSKTASGNALLLANPHLPWNDFWLFFEAHLITDKNSLYGATLVGLPTLGIGFNEHLGWTHTVNTLDNVDLYEITIDENKYLIDGEYRTFELDSSKVIVNFDGINSEETIYSKRSDFGMIIKESGNSALAVTWPNMDGELNYLAQWKRMGEANNLEEFKNALDYNALPLFNIIYSDKENNILYQFGGNVPKKNGDWEKWQEIVSTSSSSDLWNGYYLPNELPNYSNPESGWIQNANDPPYTSTIPTAINPADYASHIAPNSMIFRPQRSAKLIMDAKNLTLDEFITLKHDSKSELALRLQDDFEKLKGLTQDSLTLRALNTLTAWDASFDANSEGSVLFMNLIRQLGTSGYFNEPWSFDNPVNSPDGLSDPERILDVIKSVAKDQLDKIGSLNPQFGDIFRLKVGEYEYSGNGGPGNLGLFRTLYYVPGEDGKFYPYHGDTYVCATEFGDEMKARALMSYGNASQEGNSHVGDQLKLFSEKKLRKVWLTREEQEANLELREKLDDL